MIRRSIPVLAAVALTLLFLAPASAAPATGQPGGPHRVAQVQPTATAAPTVIATTPVVTKTKHDRRGLLGLFGLLGLLGLLKRPTREVRTVVEQPVARPVATDPRR